MKVLLIRHGRAEERRLLSAKKDAARALTEAGRRELRKVAKGLRKLGPDIDVLATSALLRARETARIVSKIFGVPDITDQPLLAPGAEASALLDWLKEQAVDAAVALVGHEPDLSRLAALLLSGGEKRFLALKKGGCALIEFDGHPAAGAGVLAWSLPPAVLRKLA